jgi:hypothetical protein
LQYTVADWNAMKSAEAPEEPTPDTKTCPACAETVKAAAKVCRYCGNKFEARRSISAHPSRRIVALVAVLVTALGGTAWAIQSDDQEAAAREDKAFERHLCTAVKKVELITSDLSYTDPNDWGDWSRRYSDVADDIEALVPPDDTSARAVDTLIDTYRSEARGKSALAAGDGPTSIEEIRDNVDQAEHVDESVDEALSALGDRGYSCKYESGSRKLDLFRP